MVRAFERWRKSPDSRSAYVEHLLGEDIPHSRLNNDTLGRVLDRLSDAGTNTLLGSVAMGVMKSFDPELSHVHHDPMLRDLTPDIVVSPDSHRRRSWKRQ